MFLWHSTQEPHPHRLQRARPLDQLGAPRLWPLELAVARNEQLALQQLHHHIPHHIVHGAVWVEEGELHAAKPGAEGAP